MNPPKTLFHYCDTASAFSILQNRSIWLNPLGSSNDSLEGKIIAKRTRTSLLERGSITEYADAIYALLLTARLSAEGFALCLSANGDQLSQWRAYADDGNGFCIGLASNKLLASHGSTPFGRNFFDVVPVQYKAVEADRFLAPFIDELYDLGKSKAPPVMLKPGYSVEDTVNAVSNGERPKFLKLESAEALKSVMEILHKFDMELYRFKDASFHEENEWRLIRHRHPAPHGEVAFRPKENRISPYIESSFPSPMTVTSLRAGPRNQTDFLWLQAMLDKLGYEKVKLLRSTAQSYR